MIDQDELRSIVNALIERSVRCEVGSATQAYYRHLAKKMEEYPKLKEELKIWRDSSIHNENFIETLYVQIRTLKGENDELREELKQSEGTSQMRLENSDCQFAELIKLREFKNRFENLIKNSNPTIEVFTVNELQKLLQESNL